MKAADAAVMPPSLLAELAGDENVLKKVSRWSRVTFGSGPLPKPAGDGLWAQIKVLQILGSTETFNLPEFVPAEIDEWKYPRYHPSLGIDFRSHQKLCMNWSLCSTRRQSVIKALSRLSRTKMSIT